MRAPPPAVPPARGAGRAPFARPLPLPPPPPWGLPPPFRPNIVCRESARQSPPRFLFPRRGGETPPRGARQNHISSADIIFSLAQISISQQCAWARSRAPPARCSPTPDARLQGGRARGAAAGSPSPWGGGALYSVAVLARLRSAPPPTRWRGLPASRGLPPPPRESGRRGRMSPPPCVFYRPHGGHFARDVRVVFAWWFFAPFPRAAERRCGAPSRSGRRNAPPATCALLLSWFDDVKLS